MEVALTLPSPTDGTFTIAGQLVVPCEAVPMRVRQLANDVRVGGAFEQLVFPIVSVDPGTFGCAIGTIQQGVSSLAVWPRYDDEPLAWNAGHDDVETRRLADCRHVLATLYAAVSVSFPWGEADAAYDQKTGLAAISFRFESSVRSLHHNDGPGDVP